MIIDLEFVKVRRKYKIFAAFLKCIFYGYNHKKVNKKYIFAAIIIKTMIFRNSYILERIC